ncbi:hypothetical protein LINGRAHAP2_LOCUS26549 [Linum grandiflorum]
MVFGTVSNWYCIISIRVLMKFGALVLVGLRPRSCRVALTSEGRRAMIETKETTDAGDSRDEVSTSVA